LGRITINSDAGRYIPAFFIMIYITILLFATLVYIVHRRRAQRWERIKRDAAKWT